jgi:hypothetical protein
VFASARVAFSVLAAGAIPWLPQRPVVATAQPPLAPACRAAELRAHQSLQGATGSLVGVIALRNAGSAPCSLVGPPKISFAGAAATTAHWRIKRLAHSPEPPDVLADPPGSLRALAPGKSAGVALYWSNWCGPAPDGFAIALGGGSALIVPTARAPRCDAPQYPSLLTVAPFMPATRHLPPSSRLPLEVAIVGPRPVAVKPGVHAFRIRRGELLHFRVAVTNTGKTSFRFAPSSCPVYIEQLDAGTARPYVLNCRPAGVIAPHQSVLFEMLIPIPATTRLGLNNVTWELAPKTFDAPFAPVDVWVVR